MVRFVTVTCPQCHATEAQPLPGESGHYRCAHCKSTFLLDRPSQGAPSTRPAPVSPAPPVLSSTVRGVVAGILIAGLAGVILYVKIQRAERRYSPPRRMSIERPRTLLSPPKVPEGPAPKVELRETQHGRTSIGGEFWLVRYANVGEVPVERPAVALSLFDQGGKRVEEQSGWSAIHVLSPGKEAPIFVLVSNPPAYAKVEIVPRAPQAPRFAARQVQLSLTETLLREDKIMGPTLIGTVRNQTNAPVRFVEVIAFGVDGSGKLASYTRGFATQRDLAPGGESGFKLHTRSFQITPPARYEYLAVGTP